MTVKRERSVKPRFELSTDSSRRDSQHSLPARGRSARYARELSFAKYYDGAGYIMARKLWTAAHSMPRAEWITSRAESEEPGASAIERISERPA